jgi:cation transport ATPase
MYEAITILICFIRKFILAYADRPRPAPPLPVYTPPSSPQLDALLARKQEIDGSIEELNTPSTFAKYSKMQRELVKLNKQIEELGSKQEEERKNSKEEFEKQLKAKQQQEEAEVATQMKKKLIIRAVIQAVLFQMLSRYYSQLIAFEMASPLAWLANEQGQINCGIIFLAASYLI